ncbi:unnamed protein product, partial [Brachionus calyciflorus]
MLILYVDKGVRASEKKCVPNKNRSKSDKDPIVLITGSGSGIGKLIAIKFAELGAQCILVDIDQKSNNQTANEILNQNGKAKTFKCDLSNRKEVYKLVN